MEEHNNNSGRPPGGGDDNKNPRNRQSILMFLIIALVAILFWNFIGNMGSSSEEITYDEFIQMLDEDKVESVEIGSSQINIISTEKDALGRNITYYTGTVPDYSLQQRLDEADVEYFSPVEDFRNVILSAIVNFLLPVLLKILFEPSLKRDPLFAGEPPTEMQLIQQAECQVNHPLGRGQIVRRILPAVGALVHFLKFHVKLPPA